jgi:hypothetical protein
MTITVMHDLDADTHVLMAHSHGRAAPAGPRLFRAPPWPVIQFKHTSREAAEKDAQTLREYLAALPAQKKMKSRAKGAHSE